MLHKVFRKLTTPKVRQMLNLMRNYDSYIILAKKDLTYAQDLLYTYNNAEFMNNDQFVEAYRLGKETDKDFLLNNYDIHWRIHVLCWAAAHAINLEGDYVDCGCGTGIFARSVMHYTNFQSTNKKYYMLDTFSGLDAKYSSENEMRRNESIGYRTRQGTFEQVKNTFAEPCVEIINGTIPDTLVQVNTSKVCYLSIDMNSVKPELAALEYFWEKLVTGGVIILDDYGYPGHEEQKTAHDKFAESKHVKILSLPTCQGIIIK